MTTGNNDPSPGFVPEKDMMAQKAKAEGLELRVTELETKTAEAHQAKLQAETAKEDLAKQLEDLKGKAPNPEEQEKLQAELKLATESGEKSTKELLELRAQIIANTYGVPMDSLQGKSESDLKLLEEGLKLGGATKKSSFDGGAGSGAASLEGVGILELARRGYEEKGKSK